MKTTPSPTACASRPRHRSAKDTGETHVRVELHLPSDLNALAKVQADLLKLPRAHWIIALVSAHLKGAPRFSRDAELALIHSRSELRQIREELATVRRRLPDQTDGGASADLVERLDDLNAALGQHMEVIRRGFETNAIYWKGNG